MEILVKWHCGCVTTKPDNDGRMRFVHNCYGTEFSEDFGYTDLTEEEKEYYRVRTTLTAVKLKELHDRAKGMSGARFVPKD